MRNGVLLNEGNWENAYWTAGVLRVGGPVNRWPYLGRVWSYHEGLIPAGPQSVHPGELTPRGKLLTAV